MNEGASISRRGLLLVLSSPSGAGKTTLARRLLEAEPLLQMSVSVTTRQPRPGEADGRDYIFIDQQEFQARIDAGDLLEHARVYDNSYGTPKQPVMAALAAGRDVLFDIDWQGAQQLREQASHDLVRVFILPPTAASLAERLTRRGDGPEGVKRRMAGAMTEISHWAEYDYVIVNADLEQSVAGLRAILAAEHLKRDRQIGLQEFVRTLQEGL